MTKKHGDQHPESKDNSEKNSANLMNSFMEKIMDASDDEIDEVMEDMMDSTMAMMEQSMGDMFPKEISMEPNITFKRNSNYEYKAKNIPIPLLGNSKVTLELDEQYLSEKHKDKYHTSIRNSINANSHLLDKAKPYLYQFYQDTKVAKRLSKGAPNFTSENDFFESLIVKNKVEIITHYDDINSPSAKPSVYIIINFKCPWKDLGLAVILKNGEKVDYVGPASEWFSFFHRLKENNSTNIYQNPYESKSTKRLFSDYKPAGLRTDYGEFTYDPEYGSYELEVDLQLFKLNSETYTYPYPYEEFTQADYDECFEEYDDLESEAPLMSFESEYELEIIPREHVETIKYITNHTKQIESAILHSLPKLIKNYTDQLKGGLKSKADEDRLQRCLEQLVIPENIIKTFTLGSIGLLHQQHDEVSCYALNFGCTWDEEHGFAMMMQKDKVLEVGGSSEFYDR